MLQSVLHLQAAPGRFDDLVDEYRRARVIEAAIPFGLVRGEALRVADRPDRLIVTSLWPDRDAYESWLAAEERERVTVGVWPLLDPAVEPEIDMIDLGADVDPARGLRPPGVADGAVLERVALVTDAPGPIPDASSLCGRA